MSTSIAGLDQDKFLTLLLAGLRNQDPLNPLDNQEFLGQLTQFTSLQGLQQMNASFGELLKLQQMAGGAGLIGRTIRYASGSSEASGRVDGLTVMNGKVYLDVGGTRVALDDVRSVAG